MNLSKLTPILALALFSASAMAETPSSGIDAMAKTTNGGKEGTPNPDAPVDMNLLSPAISALNAAGDQEAVAAVEKSKKNGGKLEITKDDGIKFIKRAQEKGLLQGAQGGQNQIGDALKALLAAGDADALAAAKKAQENGGKLEMTPEQAQNFIKRAKEKGLIKDAPGASGEEAKLLGRAQEAIQALAKAGDEEAVAQLKIAQENGGKLAIDKGKVIELVTRAKEKGLIQDTPGAPGGDEMELKKKAGEAIQALAAAGDDEAAATLKTARENGGKLQITKEKSVEYVTRAQEKGLIK